MMSSPPRYSIFKSKADSVLDWRAEQRQLSQGHEEFSRRGTVKRGTTDSRVASDSERFLCPPRQRSPGISVPVRTKHFGTLSSPSITKLNPCAPSPVVLTATLAHKRVTKKWTMLSSKGYKVVCSPNAGERYRIGIDCIPQEILEIIFGYLDTWSIGATAQVCRAWRVAVQSDKRIWANAMIPVHNPVFTPLLGGFEPSDSDRTYGAVVLSPKLRELAARCGIAKAKLIGPNIHRQPCHMKQLAVEMPELHTLHLYRCVLSVSSLMAVTDAMKNLEHVIVEAGWTSDQSLNLRFLTGLKKLTIKFCKMLDQTLIVIVTSMPCLEELDLISCDRLTEDGIQLCRRRFPGLSLTIRTTTPKPTKRPYYPVSVKTALSRPKLNPWGLCAIDSRVNQHHSGDLKCKADERMDGWDSPKFWGPLCSLYCY